MMNPVIARGAMRALGLFQTAMALTALFAPQSGARLGGMPWRRATGEGLFAWRLFAIRQLCLGLAGAAGAKPARQANRFIQPADLALFVHARRTGSVPARTSRIAIAAALCALGCSAADALCEAAERKRAGHDG